MGEGRKDHYFVKLKEIVHLGDIKNLKRAVDISRNEVRIHSLNTSIKCYLNIKAGHSIIIIQRFLACHWEDLAREIFLLIS